jgi:hypothetical protein
LPAPATTVPAPTVTVPPVSFGTSGTSDSFTASALRWPWTYSNSSRDTYPWVVNGDLTMVAFQGMTHTVSPTSDSSVRISQPIGTRDFTVDTAYESRLTTNNVWQGVSLDLGSGRTLVEAVRRVNGADFVQVTSVDSSGKRLLSSQPISDVCHWCPYPIFRVTRTGDVVAFSWSANGSAFSTPVLATGGRAVKSFAVATGNESVGSWVERHVAIVTSVDFS